MMFANVLLVSIIATHLTYFLIHKIHWPAVRASSLPTFIFAVLISYLHFPFVPALQAAFFGATFVGMTDKSRLGVKRVSIASVVFALVFVFLIPLAKGIGGGLGAAAFVSCSLVYTIEKGLRKFLPNKI